MKADLHCHSRYSDSSATVPEIVDAAEKIGLDFIAITEHDTFVGCDECGEITHNLNVTSICAAEFSCFDYDNGNKVHILCYEPKDRTVLRPISEYMMDQRRVAGNLMIESVMKYYPITKEDVCRYSDNSQTIYKQHIMQTLIDKKVCRKIYGTVFNRLFSPKRGCCVEKITYPNVYEVLSAIKKSGGLAVMAHPGHYRGAPLMRELVKSGLIDGVEVWHSHNSEELRLEILKLCKKYNLVVTGGSDFHGKFSSKNNTIGSHIVQGEYLDIFLERIKK